MNQTPPDQQTPAAIEPGHQGSSGRRAAAVGFVVVALTALAAGLVTSRSTNDPSVESRIPHAVGRTEGDTGSTDQTVVRSQTTADPSALQQTVVAGPADAGSPHDQPDPEAVPPLVVHVIGQVRSPGLVSVPPGARVQEAMMAAGGALAGADLERVNLAAPVQDGMQIRVPSIDGEEPGPFLIPPETRSTTGTALTEPASGPINLNLASVEALDTLPGVGPATATAIVTWREENGGFHSLDDLLAVPGIGPAKMAAIRDLVTL